MIFLMISCFSFILISKPSLKALQFWKRVVGLSSLDWLWREVPHSVSSLFGKSMIDFTSFYVPSMKPPVLEDAGLRSDTAQVEEAISLLDLPELALDSILERLSPASLFGMAGVCSSLKDKCTSDHLWKKHMKRKWDRVIGNAAYREWQWHIASRNRSTLLNGTNQKAIFGHVLSMWRLQWNRLKLGNGREQRSSLPVDSVMAFYLALESGKFWFPAQVYNRENGRGFMLSCYDAELSYDSSSDTFKARYLSHGRRTVEENIKWDRIRLPAIDNPAYVLYASDCLDDLKPGDHFEIQWRKSKDFPYGWWYGVVGHLESCNRSKAHCQCRNSDTVILEFNHYNPGSRWRKTAINRKDHREIGNEADGFYGGMRKLYNEEEISAWKRLWPTQVLD